MTIPKLTPLGGLFVTLLVAAGLLLLGLCYLHYREEQDCLRWRVDGAPAYVNLNGYLMPIENKTCIEWKAPR